ncbi:MAG: IPT/TIG domain-containing protein, partial [Candidatus Sulfotelmatobacter sp.]
TPLMQHTNGNLYGFTVHGGDTSVCQGDGCGVFYSFDIGAGAFASLESTSGKEGARVGIFGQGFSHSSVVKFGGTQATAVTPSGTTFLNATVPAGALTGTVTVTTGSTTLTSSRTFDVTPTTTSFSPPSGPVGTLVTINGTGLTQTTRVTFNGKSASFAVVSDIEITATVPTGATTGQIRVTTKGGSAITATSFTVN